MARRRPRTGATGPSSGCAPALPRWPALREEIFGGERDSDQRQKPPHGPTVGWRIGSIQIHPPGTHRFINSSPIAASRGCRLSEIGCGPSVSSGRRRAVGPGLFQAGEHQKLGRAITRVLWLGAQSRGARVFLSPATMVGPQPSIDLAPVPQRPAVTVKGKGAVCRSASGQGLPT